VDFADVRGGSIWGKIPGPVESYGRFHGIRAQFGDGSLAISLPRAAAEEWASTDKVSLHSEQGMADASTLSLLIEKDLSVAN
jgi:hypothetical protein